MVKFSIIIPAYNAESYIARCIQSVCQQNLNEKELEVIIINDGSTDNTLNIVQNYQKEHSFLKIISTPNRGLSNARNRGIEEADGEYLLFLDSDDSIQPFVLEIIYEEMKRDNLDMMLMNYQRIDSQQNRLNLFFQIEKNTRQVTSGIKFLSTHSFPPMVWNYAYKKDFLKRNNLWMKAIWHEDEEFTPRAIYLAQRIKYFPILFYNYYQNKESYMETYKEENFLFLVQAMGSLKRFINQYPKDIRGKKIFNQHIAKLILFYIKKNLNGKYHNQQALIKEIKKEGLLPLQPKKKSFSSILLNLSPTLFMAYYKTFKSH